MFLRTTRFTIDLRRPKVMGIVNVTPDSFADGGRDPASAIAHAERLVAEGADILDIGGESSRPGAPPVSAAAEWARVQPVLDAALSFGVPVSIDTMKTETMRRALDLGVDIVNDIRALRDAGAVELLAAHGRAGVCLMHMQGEPASMQAAPHYDDVVTEVSAFLAERVRVLGEAGIAAERVAVDPGIGFGKTPAHNWTLLRRQAELLALRLPLLVGWSRKSSLGAVTGRAISDRLAASVAAALAAVAQGAHIVRVHDVAATADALKVWDAAGLGDRENAASRGDSR